MTRLDVRYSLAIFLLVITAVAFFSGWIADRWGVTTFVLHTWSGYLMALLALAHTVLEWPRLWGWIRRRPLAPAHFPAAEQTPTSVSDRQRVRQPLITRRELIWTLVGGALGFIGGWRTSFVSPRLKPDADLGIQYHTWSKPGGLSLMSPLDNWGERPAQYKVYPNTPSFRLPKPGDMHGPSFQEIVRQRRSIRSYAARPMSQEALSQLLFCANGINAERWGIRLRAAPSAGALYPIETYVVVHRVEGLEAGVYHYAVQSHALTPIRLGDMRGRVVQAGFGQGFLGEANVVLILTAIFQRLRWKYRERTYRYALLEAGHIGQNIYLAATALEMGACAVGAFDDDAVNALVDVDGQEEAAVYMLAVGLTG